MPHAAASSSNAPSMTELQTNLHRVDLESNAITKSIYDQRAAYCRLHRAVEACNAKGGIHSPMANDFFKANESATRSRRRTLNTQKGRLKQQLDALQKVALETQPLVVRRSAIRRRHPWASRIYIYNVSLIHDLNMTAEQARAYESLVQNDREAILRNMPKLGQKLMRIRHGVHEPQCADGWLHAHLAERLGSSITTNPAEADFFWLPVWGYAFCTAVAPLLNSLELNTHMQQTMHIPCVQMGRVHEWLFRQPTWQRSHGADHIYFMNYKDRLWRAQKHLGKSYRRTRNASNALAANTIFVTAEDRHLVPEARMGCTSVVIPYYADPRRWGASGRAFEQIVAQKRTLLSFVGNIRGKACHLESGACPGDKSTGPDAAARLRSILSDSISRKTNGSVFELQGQSPETHSFADTEALLSSVFCPSPVGDTWTSKRLFTVILALCIPIIVSDHVQLPYERVGLNWSAFSLQVPEKDIHSKRVDIVEYARSVPAARVLELQRGLWEAQPLITFTPGGESAPPDASSMLLDELHQTRTCMRVVLVEKLSEPACMHQVSFGLGKKVLDPQSAGPYKERVGKSCIENVVAMWVQWGCGGVFALYANNSLCPKGVCDRVRCIGPPRGGGARCYFRRHKWATGVDHRVPESKKQCENANDL